MVRAAGPCVQGACLGEAWACLIGARYGMKRTPVHPGKPGNLPLIWAELEDLQALVEEVDPCAARILCEHDLPTGQPADLISAAAEILQGVKCHGHGPMLAVIAERLDRLESLLAGR